MGGPIECREESVARGIDLPAAESAELAANRDVVRRQESLPGAVSETDGQLGGTHDVREEHRRQRPVSRLTGSNHVDCLALQGP